MVRNEPSKGATAERNPNADKDAWDAKNKKPNAMGDDGRESAWGVEFPQKKEVFKKFSKKKINGVLLVYTLI